MSDDQNPKVFHRTGYPGTHKLGTQSSFPQATGYPGTQFPQAKESSTEPLEECYPSRIQRRQKKLRLDAKLLKIAEVWCVVHKVTMQDLIEKLLLAFLEGPAGENVAQELRIEDRSIDRMNKDLCGPVENFSTDLKQNTAKETKKTSNEESNEEIERAREILQLYASLSGNRIRAKDRQAVREIFDLPDLVIYTGIMRAALHCAGQIGSFAYCVKVMAQVAELEDIQGEFEKVREKLLLAASGKQLVLPLNTEKLLFGNFQR